MGGGKKQGQKHEQCLLTVTLMMLEIIEREERDAMERRVTSRASEVTRQEHERDVKKRRKTKRRGKYFKNKRVRIHGHERRLKKENTSRRGVQCRT